MTGAGRREEACDGHNWAIDDLAPKVDVLRWVCLKCGAEKPEEPG